MKAILNKFSNDIIMTDSSSDGGLRVQEMPSTDRGVKAFMDSHLVNTNYMRSVLFHEPERKTLGAVLAGPCKSRCNK